MTTVVGMTVVTRPPAAMCLGICFFFYTSFGQFVLLSFLHLSTFLSLSTAQNASLRVVPPSFSHGER